MTMQPTSAVGQLFDGGPPRRLESALRLVKSDNRNTSPGTVFISMVIWTSLVLLNVILPDLMQYCFRSAVGGQS